MPKKQKSTGPKLDPHEGRPQGLTLGDFVIKKKVPQSKRATLSQQQEPQEPQEQPEQQQQPKQPLTQQACASQHDIKVICSNDYLYVYSSQDFIYLQYVYF